MHEILTILPPETLVLDLGSNRGSYDATRYPVRTVRADLVPPHEVSGDFVACSASQLPFADRSFRAVILNHSLEHFEDLLGSVREIARVLASDGFLYVAVPDASTFTDRLYRWLGKGGGHVNAFIDPEAVARMFTGATGLPHAGTRVLCTSLSFLNAHNLGSRRQRKMLLFANGHEQVVRSLTYVLRRLDRWFGLRTSVYGWAFFFGHSLEPELERWTNVCVRCGSGAGSSSLQIVRRRLLPDTYTCPHCGALNYFTADRC